MFLALHRSLVDAPFFSRPAPAGNVEAAEAAEAAAAAAAAAAVDALAEPVAAAAAEAGAAHHCPSSRSSGNGNRNSNANSNSSLVRLAGGLAACVATDRATRCAEADAPPVLRAAALVVGAFANEAEVAREYRLELETGDPAEDDLAAMVLDLYGRNFEDESGDSSDEPAALLGMIRGSWALAVVAERPRARAASAAGGGEAGTEMGLHVIVARSSGRPSGSGGGNGNGKAGGGGGDEAMEEGEEGEEDEEEEEAPRPPPPLYWGASEEGHCLVVSSTPQPGLSPFPAGCLFESATAALSGAETTTATATASTTTTERGFRIDQFSRTAASAKTREVVVASAGGGGGGSGSVCGALGYKTKSGKDLAVVE